MTQQADRRSKWGDCCQLHLTLLLYVSTPDKAYNVARKINLNTQTEFIF